MECFFKENIWQNVNNKMFYEKFFSFRPSLEKSLAWNKLMAQISFITTKSLPIHNNPIPSRSDYIYLSIYHLSIYLSVYLYLNPSIYLSIYISISTYLSACLSVCLSACLSINPYERMNVKPVCVCVLEQRQKIKSFSDQFSYSYITYSCL